MVDVEVRDRAAQNEAPGFEFLVGDREFADGGLGRRDGNVSVCLEFEAERREGSCGDDAT